MTYRLFWVQKVLHASMPFMVFCLTGVSAGAMGLVLPETLNKPVAETLEELSSPAYQRILDTQVTVAPPTPGLTIVLISTAGAVMWIVVCFAQVDLLADEHLSKRRGSESE